MSQAEIVLGDGGYHALRPLERQAADELLIAGVTIYGSIPQLPPAADFLGVEVHPQEAEAFLDEVLGKRRTIASQSEQEDVVAVLAENLLIVCLLRHGHPPVKHPEQGLQPTVEGMRVGDQIDGKSNGDQPDQGYQRQRFGRNMTEQKPHGHENQGKFAYLGNGQPRQKARAFAVAHGSHDDHDN